MERVRSMEERAANLNIPCWRVAIIPERLRAQEISVRVVFEFADEKSAALKKVAFC
jgi:hypothetical protein